MAVESPPTSGGALWLENWIFSSSIAAYTEQHVNYPAERLLSPHRSDTWQSSTLSTNFITFDVGAVRAPTGFALVGSNLDGGAYVRLRGSDDTNGAVNRVLWDLPLYRQDRIGKVLRWYLGDPTEGTLGDGRQFWAVSMVPGTFGSYNTTESYYEIGVVWLGEYLEIRPWEGIRIRPKDPSPSSKAFGQARWSFPLNPYREAEVPLGGLSMERTYRLEEQIRAQGRRHAILDVHAFATTAPALKRGGCLYGYFAEEPGDASIDSPDNNSLTISFEEANG